MMIKTYFSAKAPGKLIISGEHSVVYGAPAIAMAINQYAITTVGWRNKSVNLNNNKYPKINFNLLNIKYAKSHTLKALNLLKSQLQTNYYNFLHGYCGIKDVIKKPFELLQYLVTSLIETLHLQISENLDIQVNSKIPIGAGLGSSAALIISCLRSLSYLFKINWDPIKFWHIAKEIENLQHGKSSGLDLYTATFGGCNYFNYEESNRYTAHNIIFPDFNLKIINTGKPLANTGECVAFVKNYFLDPGLLKEFTLVTEAVKQALINQDHQQFIHAIRANHLLLSRLKVVPEKIQKFIKLIENAGGAAKICGAGSIYGDNAGIIMLFGDLELLAPIVAAHKYQLQDLKIDYNGVQIV